MYPTFEELGIAPDYLWIGAVALRNLRATNAPHASARSQEVNTRKHVKQDRPRACLSRYVGVTQRRHRWMAQWGPRGQTVCKVFTDAPEDELKAAWFRARALGLSEPEVR